MATFFNTRIEGPLAETFKGYNQFVYTGGVDDLFLMDSSKDGFSRRLCKIGEAFREYGRKHDYDFIITLGADLKPVFPCEEQKIRFEAVARGDSRKLVDGDHKGSTHRFVPKRKENSAAAKSSPTASAAPEKKPSEGEQKAAKAVSEMGGATQGKDSANALEQIKRVLEMSGLKTLVILPEADSLIPLADADAAVIDRLKTVVKGWRDIIQKANSESRTILIVNPHRLQDFHNLERKISCYDHNCREVTIGKPSVDEMRAWLNKYRMENGIQGGPSDAERVVLTGKANAGGNLQNFVSWVQAFYQGNPDKRDWKSLLSRENQEAVDSKEDILGKLNSMIGLAEVKDEIASIVKEAEKDPVEAAKRSYHMFFLGNPGTGKTEVANLVAKLFWAMELRTSRKVVSVAIQDIVSQYNEGDTIQRMKDKVQEAMGGVLFIDEAYLFAESEWGRKAFQVLLTEMENNRKNLTVILAGYAERLQALKDINPGIDSRIPIKLHFKDYDKDEKLRMFNLFLENSNKEKQKNRRLDDAAEKKLLRILDGYEGNGRGVRNILERVLKSAGESELITEEHVIDPHATHPDEARAVMDEIERDFIGMQPLKDRLRSYFRKIEFEIKRSRALGLSRREGSAYRIRFTGPPGTGKTSIARYMGRFFHAMGVCETDQMVECGATSLKGAYIGHAQQAVNNLFHDNRGKVIFIDEIYSLYNPGAHQDDSFSREVIDTLVRCLTAAEYQNTVVIVAGYKDKVDEFMQANQGLASRIPEEIEFCDYEVVDCVKIFESAAGKAIYSLDEGCRQKLEACFACMKSTLGRNFGNARDVKGFLGTVKQNLIDRLAKMDSEPTVEDYKTIKPEDIPDVKEA